MSVNWPECVAYGKIKNDFMRILFFSRLFYPHIGGVEKHVFEISKGLIKKGYKVTVITERYDKNLTEKEKIEEILIYRIPVGENERFKKFQIWWWFIRHIGLLKKADIIHCHDVFFWYLPFRIVFLRKPVYATFHGYESYPISKKAIFVHKISEMLSGGNICIGDFIKKWYGTKPTHVSYGGLDSKKFKDQPFRYAQNKSLKFKANNRLSALFVGRLDEQTSILDYCKVVEKIRKIYPRFKFIVAGDGKFRKEVEKTAEVLGFVNNPEFLYPSFRFVFVSRYLSILEAMAAKRLVFSIYDNPVKKDYLLMNPFTNYVITGGSSDEISKKVLFYLKNKEEEKKLLGAAFDWVKNQSWDNVVNIYVSLWSGNNKI